MTHPTGYSGAQIALHWIVALLVAGQYIFKDSIASAWDAIRQGTDYAFDPLIPAHVAGGGLILVFILWRLALRLTHGAPPPPENEPAPLKVLSHVAHWAFYVVLAIMSVSGALAWFADLTIAAQVHNIFKVVLLALVALHVLAIPFHRIVLKNNVMVRMLRPAR
ncbi:cytochrome B [Rhizobium sp. S-51]|jgi:cytochrome b561|uniref:Cytochrome B n=1 Tax=Rhizobium terricola TaxID=2728849 RepID=A0A7Y0AZQ4_9HYPH|nr:cytochrome b/b6 domain-containing protein [Rhizobium terricola]NML76373.1 cytochrome B [Rhizobium terricola]